MSDTPTIGIVGVTGAVGTELLKILHDHGHPSGSIRCFGSSRSAGSNIEFGQCDIRIEPLNAISQAKLDFALLCADAETAIQTQQLLADTQAIIIDNSSAFRLESSVPLVVPEINGDLITESTKVIANPNCSTVMLVSALNPIRRAFGIRSLQVSTYQAVSGAGRAGLDELYSNTASALEGLPATLNVFPHTCAFNVFEHESSIDPATGFNGEESKMIAETRKIWRDESLEVIPTCVRVPVERTHSQAIIAELCSYASIEDIRSCLVSAGIDVEIAGSSVTPLDVTGSDSVKIGRIRTVHSGTSCKVILWACCDQLRKGAALNAYQILQFIIARTHSCITGT